MASNYSNILYKDYENECNKNKKQAAEIKKLKLENSNLKSDISYIKKQIENKLKSEIEKIVKPIEKENDELKSDLRKANEEIVRLKEYIEETINPEKDYKIDKLTNQINKNSTNSSIPTSKEIRTKEKTGANTYNLREKSNRSSGGQIGHKGTTLTKSRLEEKIKEKNLEVNRIIHHVNNVPKDKEITKYRIGIKTEVVVEEHVFVFDRNSKEQFTKEFQSDVTYDSSVKALVSVLGNYYCIGYNKVQEFLSDLTNGIITISEGTIDNIYQEFSSKTEETLNNITTNILNGSYQHTDETCTKLNGKDAYYRGYGNPLNVLYKFHLNKGDTPIEEDGILTDYFGTVISDHDTGIFKYGTSNQDCVVHLGRYCKEEDQNIDNISWPIRLYYMLLRFERNRKILEKFGRKKFYKAEIQLMENEYDELLKIAEEEIKDIKSTYWKEKSNTLLKRCRNYKSSILFYIHDFKIPYDNNFMERALRMIKGKTKNSGGFRSENGATRFGNIMSIIKTAKLRKMNPFDCINDIYQGKALFA